MEPEFKFDTNSAARVRSKLRIYRGKTTKIVGRLREGMKYAYDVEVGTRRLPPYKMAHMTPAFAEFEGWARKNLPIIVRKEFARASVTGVTKEGFDKFLHKVVVGAVFELEKLRVKWLRHAIYTALRWSLNPRMSYKLTQNLMNNRIIDVLSLPAGGRDTFNRASLPVIDTRA